MQFIPYKKKNDFQKIIIIKKKNKNNLYKLKTTNWKRQGKDFGKASTFPVYKKTF